jgi:5-methylcytosine-specific restriction endonuclease McrA
MANKVFANMMEISCKAGQGKSICAFPDVCLSPPTPPAGPVPIPYPNTGMASDCTSGSKQVKISGDEVMLKNKSFFKKSMGDEAATKSLGMGVVTHQIQGKVYFKAWSMDVKIEGENAVRHLDIMTHNHMSDPGNTPPWPEMEGMSPPEVAPPDKPCDKSKCPKEPDEERSKKLRKKSPSRAIRKKFNKVPGTCQACGSSVSSQAADHLVPLDIIKKMPGYACLSEENQIAVANHEPNFVGLCKSCNSSKCAKLWHKWTGVQSRGISFLPSHRKEQQQATNKMIIELKKTIKSKKCG